jgi:U3 small nucleolar RNA-associated protein 4
VCTRGIIKKKTKKNKNVRNGTTIQYDSTLPGSPDTLRVWDVESGHPTVRISTGRTEKRRETIVWSVAVTDDFTIISGDSRGKTCFWNGKMGTQIDAYQTHKADVLTVALSPNQEVAYSSGVDPVIMHFQPVVRGDGAKKKWIKSIHRNVHSHDVRSIAATDTTIFSAGIDSLLAVNDIPSRSLAKYPPVPQGECVVVASKAGLIVMRHPKFLEVWKLGTPAEGGEDDQRTAGSILPLSSKPIKVLQLATKDDETIRSCHISADGQWIGYATCTRLRVYRLQTGEKVQLQRAKVESAREDEIQIAHHFKFYGNNGLVAATERGALQFYEINGDELTVRLSETIAGKRLELTGGVSHLAVTTSGAIVVAADFAGNVAAVEEKSKKLVSKMPRYQKAPITALALCPATDDLVVAYADNHVVECQTSKGRYTKFSRWMLGDQLPKQWQAKKTATRGIVHLGRQKLVLYDDVHICVAERKQPTPAAENPPSSKLAKEGDLGNNGSKKGEYNTKHMRITKKYEHLIYLGLLADDKLVAVEVRPQSIEEQLPPSLRQKKFGAM